jgi:hypothetical protein
MSSVGCQFAVTVNGAPATLKVLVVAASKGSVMSALAPVIQMDSQVRLSQLEPFVSQALPPGQVRLAPGPTPLAAVGRFDAGGPGEVIGEVAVSSVDPATGTEPSGVDLDAVTKTLLQQIKL